MFLKEVYRGWFWNKKRYYHGWAQNVHNGYAHGFLIEADWFDTLTREKKESVYRWSLESAYKTSMVKGGGYGD